MKYTVYFEIYDKQIIAKVNADSEDDAKQQILDRVKFRAIVKQDRFSAAWDEFVAKFKKQVIKDARLYQGIDSVVTGHGLELEDRG